MIVASLKTVVATAWRNTTQIGHSHFEDVGLLELIMARRIFIESIQDEHLKIVERCVDTRATELLHRRLR